MNSAWTKIAFANLYWSKWLNSSYFYRLVGILSSWQEGSWLFQWKELIGACLIGIILIFSPFVSTSLIGVLLLAVTSYWIILTLSEKEQQSVTPIHILVFIYWLVATIAMAFSPVKADAFSGWIILTLYLGLFALAARILRSTWVTTRVITAFLLVSLLVSTYGIHQELIGVEQLATWNDPNSPFAQDTRVYSYLGNPNLLGGYLLSAIALSIAAVFIWRSWLQKALAMTMVGANSACLYFTDSRGAWLAMAAMIAVLLLLLYFWWREYLPRFWRVWLLPLVFGGLGGFLIVAIISVEPLRLRFLSIFAGRADDSNNFRINVWEAVFKMIKDYPLTGIGPGHDAFNQVYPRYMNSRYPALSAYSIFLEHLVEMGYVGLGCFLWLIVVTFNYGIRQINRLRSLKDQHGLWVIAATAAIVGLLAHGIVDTVWYRPQISTLWWFMLAILASQWSTVPTEEVDREQLLESNIAG